MKRRFLCPGSAKMELGLPDTTTPEAEHGTMLHEIMAGIKDEEGLSADDLELIRKAREMRDNVHKQVLSPAGKGLAGAFGELRREIEVELYLRDGDLNPLISGHADEALVNDKKRSALIIDYKFGKVPVDDAPKNQQLMTYAVMLADQEDLDEVWAAIIQPAIDGNENTTIALYTKEVLDTWKKHLLEITQIVNEQNPPLNPSQEACHYCRARGICPAARAELNKVVAQDPIPLSIESLPELLEKCVVAERVVEKIRSAARELLAESPMAIPGWRLKPVQRRVVKDPSVAFEQLSDMIEPKEFTQACSVRITELEKIYIQTAVAGGKKPGEAKREFAEKMATAIDLRTDSWLVRDK